jgi:hypothetical protein
MPTRIGATRAAKLFAATPALPKAAAATRSVTSRQNCFAGMAMCSVSRPEEIPSLPPHVLYPHGSEEVTARVPVRKPETNAWPVDTPSY